MLPPLHYTTDLWCQKQCGTCTKQASRPKENNRRHIYGLLIWQRRQKHALIQQMVMAKLDTNLQKTDHRSIYTTLPQIQLKPGHYLNLKLKHSNNGWFQHLSLTKGLVIQGEKKLCRETLELNNVINQMGLKDIYRTLHPSTKGYTLFSASHEAFFKIGDILGHDVSTNMRMKSHCILSCHQRLKLVSGKEFEKFLEFDDSGKNTPKALGHRKAILREKSIAICAHIKNFERTCINNLMMHMRALEKNKQHSQE